MLVSTWWQWVHNQHIQCSNSHYWRIQQILNKSGGTMSWIFIIFFWLMHYDGKNEKTQVIFFLEIYLLFKLNLKFEKIIVFQFLYLLCLSSNLKNSKCYLLLNSLWSDYINSTTGLEQKQKCFSNMKFFVFKFFFKITTPVWLPAAILNLLHMWIYPFWRPGVSCITQQPFRPNL